MWSWEGVAGDRMVRGGPAAPEGATPPWTQGMRRALSHTPSITTGATLAVGDGVEVVSFRCAPGRYEPPPFEGHVISLRRSASQRVLLRIGERELEGTRASDGIAIVPAGQPYTFDVQETTETLSVVLHEAFLRRIAERAGADPESVEVLASVCVRDPLLERFVLSFLPEIEGSALGGELYAEALAAQLAVHLLRRHSSLGRRGARDLARLPSGPAPSRAISRALDYANDNLSDTLSLEGMAGAAGYSPHHFARLFKEATGLPPHRYVLEERVRKARGLLEGTEVPLAEVARSCGFSSQSHMGRAVKALAGATPARLRREGRR